MFAATVGVLFMFIKSEPVGDGKIGVILGSLAVAACLLWSAFKLGANQSLARFQQNLMISLALAEFVMLAGLFLDGHPANVWKYAASSLTLIVVFIMPRIALV